MRHLQLRAAATAAEVVVVVDVGGSEVFGRVLTPGMETVLERGLIVRHFPNLTTPFRALPFQN